jgi:hypothetical protein
MDVHPSGKPPSQSDLSTWARVRLMVRTDKRMLRPYMSGDFFIFEIVLIL